MASRRPNCRRISLKNLNISYLQWWKEQFWRFSEAVLWLQSVAPHGRHNSHIWTFTVEELDYAKINKKRFDSHTGGEQHGQKHSQTPFKLKVSTLFSVVVSFQGHLPEHRAKTTEKYVTVPILTSCAVQKYRPSNNRGIESASLCQCLKKTKLHVGSLAKLVFGRAFI